MPRAAEPLLRLVPIAEVLIRLGVKRTTFQKHWRKVFTPRFQNGASAGWRGRVVLSDELEAAVLHGRDAVLTVRKAKGRL